MEKSDEVPVTYEEQTVMIKGPLLVFFFFFSITIEIIMIFRSAYIETISLKINEQSFYTALSVRE